MARTKPGITSIQVIMPEQARDALKEHIKNHKDIPSISDLIRTLLDTYCRDNGIEADFNVNEWGGHRGRPPKAKDDEQS